MKQKRYKAIINLYNYTDEFKITKSKCFKKGKEYLEVGFEYEREGYLGLIDEQGRKHLTESRNFILVS